MISRLMQAENDQSPCISLAGRKVVGLLTELPKLAEGEFHAMLLHI